MTVQISVDDPALALWQRCDLQDLAKFWHRFDERPVPVGAIARDLGLRIVSKTLPTNISGSIRPAEDSYVIEVNNTDAPVRQRFTVSHEIGHYLLHRHLIGIDGITDTILYRSSLSNSQEAEANRLAAAILLPWQQVNAWHMATFNGVPAIENVERIADAFRASRLAVGYRFGF